MKETGSRVDALAEGDLSARKESDSIVREIRNLLQNTSQMQRNLAQVIGGVQEVSGELLNSVRQVAEGSNATTEQAGQISQAMEQLSSAAEEMAENVQNISDRMDEIGEAVNDISVSAGQLQKDSEEIQDNSKKAGEGMEKIMTGSNRSVESVNTITAKIHETNDYIEKIDEAVALIFSISGQTNLLSLNASIEAARAGEAGRGFAVVAEEIRKLSEQSAAGAEQIKNLAQGIMETKHCGGYCSAGRYTDGPHRGGLLPAGSGIRLAQCQHGVHEKYLYKRGRVRPDLRGWSAEAGQPDPGHPNLYPAGGGLHRAGTGDGDRLGYGTQ